MDYYERTRREFTAYIKTVVKNSSTDYRRELLQSLRNEIFVSDFANLPKELLSYDDSSFSLERDITYSTIENFFANEKYYRAMKRLTDQEKLVLYLTVIEEKQAEQVAEIMNTTRANIWQIKSRAIKKFLHNLTNEN